MNPILKRILFVVAFVGGALVAPTIILLILFDASTQFSAYALVYGIIIFSVFGYVIASVRDMSKQLTETMEEIKKQNAAIAHKIAGGQFSDVVEASVQEVIQPKVNLNPDEPLVVTKKVKAQAKPTDDGFDDFK